MDQSSTNTSGSTSNNNGHPFNRNSNYQHNDNQQQYYHQNNHPQRRHSSGTGAYGGGGGGRGRGGYNNPQQNPMQFRSSNQPPQQGYGGFHRNQHDGPPRRPRGNYRSNNEWHGQPAQTQGYNHADYNVWSNNGTNAPSSMAQSSAGNNMSQPSHQHQSPGQGPRVHFSSRPIIHPIPTKKRIDYRQELKNLCEKHKLPSPQYTAKAAKEGKYHQSDFFCNLVIGEEKWQTSPKSYATKDEAEQMAAKKAYDDISHRYKSSSSTTTDGNSELDTEILIDKVKKIVRKKKTSYFAHGVEEEFKRKYKTDLPSNWIDIITNMCDEIKVEKNELSNSTVVLLTYTEILIPFFELEEEDKQDEWIDIRVRSVNSPSSFWVTLLRIVNADGKFAKFTNEMKQFYESTDQSNVLPLEKFTKGTLAAVKHNNDWFRFQVKELVKVKTENNEKDKSNEDSKSNESSKDEKSSEDKENSEQSNENEASNANSSEEGKEKSSEENNDQVTNDEGKEESSNKKENEEMVRMVKGYLIDYGVEFEFASNQLKVLNDQFKLLPRQAVECCLLGVKSATGQGWSDEAKKFFSERTLNNAFCINAHPTERGRMLVDLIDTSKEEDVKIAEELVEKNFAIKIVPSN